jgi:uncharacterized membrane protein YdbT with pleckstrin-like domain
MPTIYQAPSDKAKGAHTPVGETSRPSHRIRPLTAFAMAPDNVRFETQTEEETVELFLRQHFVVNVPWIILSIILFVVPTFLEPLLMRAIPPSFAVPAGYWIVGTASWYVAAFGFTLANFLYWFFNIYIVTNERVVDIDFYYLLYKRFSEAELNKIQDISYSSGGLAATVFDYGNVVVETAGETPNLEFDKVPHPQRIVSTIRALTDKTRKQTI